MKSAFTLIILFSLILTGCSKSTESTPLSAEEQIAKYLSGDGNRYWHLKAVFQNDLPITLTTSQLQYTKTFTLTPGETVKGTFTDNDLKGTWKVINSSTVRLEFYSIAGGAIRLDCDIVSVSASKLDYSYVAGNVKTEEVYYAY